MLGAIVSLLVVLAAAYALTQVGGVITLAFVAAVLFLAYRRLSLLAFTVTFTVLLALYTTAGAPAGLWKGLLWVLLAGLWLLNVRPLRKALITRPFLGAYLRLLPSMSQTEKEALEAGTVWWDGELFTGAPDWSKLRNARPPQLSAEEQAFLDGPCEELCRMLDDWDITHERADLPPEVWELLKTRGFFAMIIPKKYGGLEFSAYAHSCVLAKIASRSATAASNVAVPNSLGPAELLNHYGTEEQKNHYLPRLARGDEIPCFALTGPRVGSDAAAIPDTGIVCRGMWQGARDPRPPAQFLQALHHARADRDRHRARLPHVRSGQAPRRARATSASPVALIPRDTPGINIGRRHFPLNIPFQNGPIQGHDVFVPLDFIIGGPAMAGSGWRMLVEQLSVGRCISLPSNATGGVQGGRVGHRRLCAHPPSVQHAGRPVRGRRGGDRAHGRPHLHHGRGALGHRRCDRRRREALGALGDAQVPRHRDGPAGRQRRHGRARRQGHHAGTEQLSRARLRVTPVAITVEGANILTRNLIIFGQGAIRCHPFVLREMTAARNPDRAPASMSSIARCSGTSASPSPTPCAPSSWRSPSRASRAPRSRARPRATTSTSSVSAPRSPSRWTWRC